MRATIATNPSPGELRDHRHSTVLLDACIKIDGDNDHATLLHLSTHGAIMDAELPPRVGAKVMLMRLETEGEVIWVDGHRFGLGFRRPIHPLQVAAILGRA